MVLHFHFGRLENADECVHLYVRKWYYKLMDAYLANYESYTKYIVYNFKLGDGGIGDFCKFFMYLLCMCVTNKYRICYLVNDITIEKYMILKHKQFYIRHDELPSDFIIATNIRQILDSDCTLITPSVLYNVYNYDAITIQLQDIFTFSEQIHANCDQLFPKNLSDYVSLHLRLGDKYLETDKAFVVVTDDERYYDEGSLFQFIELNTHLNIIFFCDNNGCKQHLKSKYPSLIIIDAHVGHTSLFNTTEEQIIDAVTEFYIMCNSSHIYSASSFSGFSIMAAKFKNTPITSICGK